MELNIQRYKIHIKSSVLVAVAFICHLGFLTLSFNVNAASEQNQVSKFNAGETLDTRRPKQGKRRSPPANVKLYSDLQYAQVDGQALLLDLYMPQDEKIPPPLIIWIHGGGWVNGDKTQVNPAVMQLSGKGYAFAALNYRMNGLKSHPDQIQDIKGAVRWLRQNAKLYGYDASRIGAGGGSAGGHLALLLGLSANDKFLEGNIGGNLEQSSKVHAILNMYGPSDLQKLAASDGRFRKTKSSDPELLHSASPLTYLSEDDPPLIIIHGDQDKVVPVSQSVFLQERYQQAGLDSSLHIIEGAGHGGRVYSDSIRQQQIKAFFDKHIKFYKSEHIDKLISSATIPSVEKLQPEKSIVITEKQDFTSSKPHGFHWMVGPRSGLAGSDAKFNTLLSQIDQTLLSNSLISGVYLITHWNLLEEQEGKYHFERLDRIIKLIRSHGRYYKLAVAPGIYSPDWLYLKGAKAFETLGSNPDRASIYNKPIKIPLPWDTVYQSSYFSVLEQVSKRYGNDEFFRAVTLTVATFMSPEWHLPHSAVDRKEWKRLGAFDMKLENAWKDGIARFAKLFPHQFLMIEASSYPIRNQRIGDSIIEFGVKNYPGRFAVQINQLSGKFDQIDSPTYAKLIDYRNKYASEIIIGLQNVKGWSFPKSSEKQGSKEMTAYNYLQAGGEYWELWFGDAKNKETVELLNNLLEQGRKEGLEKFKAKLISNDKYHIRTRYH